MISKLTERIIAYLEKEPEAVEKKVVEQIAKKHKFSKIQIQKSFKELDNVANIGQWSDQKTKVRYLRWYEPDGLTDHVQECLDRGDDW